MNNNFKHVLFLLNIVESLRGTYKEDYIVKLNERAIHGDGNFKFHGKEMQKGEGRKNSI